MTTLPVSFRALRWFCVLQTVCTTLNFIFFPPLHQVSQDASTCSQLSLKKVLIFFSTDLGKKKGEKIAALPNSDWEHDALLNFGRCMWVLLAVSCEFEIYFYYFSNSLQADGPRRHRCCCHSAGIQIGICSYVCGCLDPRSAPRSAGHTSSIVQACSDHHSISLTTVTPRRWTVHRIF